MRLNQKVTGTAAGVPAGLGLGLLISGIITLAGAAAVSHLIATEKMGEGTIDYAAMVVLTISAAMGAWGAAAFVKRLRLQVCLLSGACYYLFLLAFTALFFGGQYAGMGVTAVAVLIGCGVVAFIPRRKGQNWRKGKKAYR